MVLNYYSSWNFYELKCNYVKFWVFKLLVFGGIRLVVLNIGFLDFNGFSM